MVCEGYSNLSEGHSGTTVFLWTGRAMNIVNNVSSIRIRQFKNVGEMQMLFWVSIKIVFKDHYYRGWCLILFMYIVIMIALTIVYDMKILIYIYIFLFVFKVSCNLENKYTYINIWTCFYFYMSYKNSTLIWLYICTWVGA